MAFGKKVRELRLAQKLTKEEFCGDEAELSVRQLTRIESGQSVPTLAKVEYIAHRLGVKIGELTDESFELPDRYKELKYLLLRTQTYLEHDRVAKRENYLEEIFDYFYDDLPEEEQLVVEILQSRLDIIKQANDFSAQKILDDYLEQMKHKSTYTINDLILVDLYAMYLPYQEYSSKVYNKRINQHIIETLLRADDYLKIDELPVLIKTISSMASNSLLLKDKTNLFRLILKMEKVMFKIQDFQRTPILNLLKWKYYLLEGDIELARKYYADACAFSNLTQDLQLTMKLEAEWEQDTAHQ